MKEQAFANAVTAVTTIAFLLCAFWAAAAPGSFTAFFSSWFHGIDLTSIAPKAFNFGQFLFGLVTYLIVVWLGAYFVAKLYNNFAK